MQKLFLLTVLVFYLLFSFQPEFSVVKYELLGNDFSIEGVASWLYSQMLCQSFIFFLSSYLMTKVNDKDTQVLLKAIMLDTFISSCRFVIFGPWEPWFIAPITNSVPVIIVFTHYLKKK